MPAFPRPSPPPPSDRCAVVVSRADLNRARSHRALDRGGEAPVEAHPWAYAFPRPAACGWRRD
ncbi:hypothetical protein PMI01_01044 [Caulobacter sp. AP07]|uniref:hypothetical protein n=1 Tax=Caulobacter sp. AP07 TaxID=1144304 RepID=UPI000271D9B1|nr:hypothetical protein [Caulobacter sp. AP07]EJL36270.1 hypothetical protein PMI01_01044 [Caulobacter sp. AP07]